MTEQLPVNLDAERFVLGSVLLDDVAFPEGLAVDHFSTERHRRIWRRMCDLRARGERVEYVALANELQAKGEFEQDTLSYLVGLTDGLPQVPHIDSWVRILQDKAARRRIIFACENLKGRCMVGGEDLAGITAAGQELFSNIAAPEGQCYRSVEDIPCIAECGSSDIEYVRAPELPRGAVVALTGGPGCGKSTLATAWARDAWRHSGIPTLVLDRENPVSVIADRLERLGMEDGPGIRFWGGWLQYEPPQPDEGVIREWAKEHHGLIVVDSFSAFGPTDQNDAGETRRFMNRCRRVADLGATVLVIHHDGKSETARDYRGSSDFKAAVDQAYHVSNFGGDGHLDKLVLRPFKSRIGAAIEISYQYAGGRFVRGDEREATQTASEQLTAILRLNPGVNGKRFEDLAVERGLGRNQARVFLSDGVLSEAVRYQAGTKNMRRYFLAGAEDQHEL